MRLATLATAALTLTTIAAPAFAEIKAGRQIEQTVTFKGPVSVGSGFGGCGARSAFASSTGATTIGKIPSQKPTPAPLPTADPAVKCAARAQIKGAVVIVPSNRVNGPIGVQNNAAAPIGVIGGD